MRRVHLEKEWEPCELKTSEEPPAKKHKSFYKPLGDWPMGPRRIDV